MIEFYQEYDTIVLLTIVSVLLIMTFISIGYHRVVLKYFSSRKFKIHTHLVREPSTNQRQFSLHVFNHNITDSRIVGLGYMYRDQAIDYFETYRKSNAINEGYKVIISSRDSIQMSVDVKEFKQLIRDMNQGKKRVAKIQCYATDSLGLMTLIKAKQLRKVIKRDFKVERKVVHSNIKAEKHEIRVQKRLERKQRRKYRIQSFKGWLTRLRLRIKKLFTFKRKNK